MRAQVEKKMAQKEKEKKEEKLRELAQMARDQRAGIRSHGDKGESCRLRPWEDRLLLGSIFTQRPWWWVCGRHDAFSACRRGSVVSAVACSVGSMSCICDESISASVDRISECWNDVSDSLEKKQQYCMFWASSYLFPLIISDLISPAWHLCSSCLFLFHLDACLPPLILSVSRSWWWGQRGQGAWHDPHRQKEGPTARQEHFQGCSRQEVTPDTHFKCIHFCANTHGSLLNHLWEQQQHWTKTAGSCRALTQVFVCQVHDQCVFVDFCALSACLVRCCEPPDKSRKSQESSLQSLF